jgi:SAM-dependent methyltransferase
VSGEAGRESDERKASLKSRIDAWEWSPSGVLRAAVRVVRAAGAVRRFLLNPRIRSEQITRALHRASHIQDGTYTERDRYPELFAACACLLAFVESPKVLCFGCATGEEAFSLAERMPRAEIVGVDLNRWCLAQARRKNGDARVRFVHALSREFGAISGCDAIFAMAVLQRSENRDRTQMTAHRGFGFAEFEREIVRLDGKLKPGGLFFIDHADFRFEDTAVAAGYAPLKFPGSEFTHDRPLFGRDNRLIATRYTMQRAFQKAAQ